MIELKLNRVKSNKEQTLGQLYVYIDDELVAGFHSLEKPNLNNKKRVSCIPIGVYSLGLWDSPNHPNTFQIKGVPDRSYILIHKGNFNTDSLGCVLIGMGKYDINQDGIMDITRSGEAMNHLNDLIRELMSKGEEAVIRVSDLSEKVLQ